MAAIRKTLLYVYQFNTVIERYRSNCMMCGAKTNHSSRFVSSSIHIILSELKNTKQMLYLHSGIRKAVRHARMAHKATKWPIEKILTGPVMRPDRTKLVK